MNFEKYIDNQVMNQSVLEIGGIGDYKNYALNDFKNWRHLRLKQIAHSLYAVDINKEAVNFLNDKGFNFIEFDVETSRIEDKIGKFDKIVMLDVIEHLNNIGLALSNLKNYMHPCSELIISTPNPLAFNNIFRALTWKKINTLEDHTCFIDAQNFFQLAKRYNFNVEEIHYFTFDGNSVKQKLLNFLGNINKIFHQNILVRMTIKS